MAPAAQVRRRCVWLASSGPDRGGVSSSGWRHDRNREVCIGVVGLPMVNRCAPELLFLLALKIDLKRHRPAVYLRVS